MTTKDELTSHNEQRKSLWSSAWIQTANASDCKSTDTATRWADAALKAFDERFPTPKVEPPIEVE